MVQAIESSLVGTAGHSLVKDLYNGCIVNQISCLECGRVSEREEDFLDLNVTVGGNDSLADALQVRLSMVVHGCFLWSVSLLL